MTKAFTVFKDKLLEIQTQTELLEKCLNQTDNKEVEKAAILEESNIKESLKQRKHHLDVRLKELDIIQAKLKEGSLVLNKIKIKLEDKQNFDFNQDMILHWINFSFIVKEIAENNLHPIKLHDNYKKGWKEFIDIHISLYNLIVKLDYEETQSEDKDIKYVIKEAFKHALKALIDMGLRISLLSNEEVENLNLGDIDSKESKNMLVFLSSVKQWDSVYKKLVES
ncbi:MAG: hypothetical protein AAF208_08270 [Cyanobacteria bacterium P01_A01_bin.45]